MYEQIKILLFYIYCYAGDIYLIFIPYMSFISGKNDLLEEEDDELDDEEDDIYEYTDKGVV